MEKYIQKYDLGNRIMLTGFINQAEIPLYYRAADIFVMCSGLGETWGLSVNEAMNFGLPVIVSDTCGSAYDLVRNNINGSVFETANISQLASLLHEYLNLSPERRTTAAKSSLDIIDEYSFDHIITSIKSLS
jgi:glycosyltransferase involved in cell wall biosynthesis